MSPRLNIAGVAGVVVGVLLIAGTWQAPGDSAAFPRLIAYTMLVLGVTEIIRSVWFGPNEAERAEETVGTARKASIGPVLVFGAGSLLYLVLFPIIGFYTVTLVYLVTMLLVLGVRSVALYLGLPVALVAVTYIAFTTQLHVPLPRGILI